MGVQSLDWSTGAGWPFTRLGADKREVLLWNIEWSDLVDRLVRGGYPFCSMAPKEEVRDISKLEQGSIRTFMPFSMDVQVLGAMVSYDLNQAIAAAWESIPITIGIELFNGGWSRFVHHLPFSWLYQSCDAPKWDGSFAPELFEVCALMHKTFYDERDHYLIDTLMRCVGEGPMILPNGLIVWRQGGMPSGAPITILWNSFARLFMLCYHICTQFSVLPPDLGRLITFRVHGDDGILGAVEEAREWFNDQAINRTFESFNWPTAWVADPPHWQKREDLVYLSHATTYVNGHAMPFRPDHSKILTALAVGARAKPPPGETLTSYRLTRMWQIANMCWPDRAFHRRLVAMLLRYQEEVYEHSPEFIRAIQQRKGDRELWSFFTGKIQQ